jgi:RNA methyltransferase, TrmH family
MNQPQHITSLTNDKIKFVRSLEMRKVRKETGLFVAEGTSILVTARDHGIAPETLIYLAGSAEHGIARGLILGALAAGAACLEVSPQVLAKLAEKDNPQALMGVFRQRWSDPPLISPDSKNAVWLALEEVRDPGNLGTILRTADAVGVAGVILVGTCCDPYQRECVRATMGSIFAVPMVRLTQDAFLDVVVRWPGTIAGTHLRGVTDFRDVHYRRPTLLVMGGEGPGLSDAVATACTDLVKIPMAGDLDSLNLAIATALLLYQVQGASLRLTR